MMSDASERIAAICSVLDAAYGRPDLGNYTHPVDELIYILLSTMTTEANYRRSFARLRQRFPTWEDALAAPVDTIRETIADGGLARTKARLIHALLGKIKSDWGAFELSFMQSWETPAIRDYLSSLPGIGQKAAACTLAYSFGRDVCPVDTHTYRVTVRLGILSAEARETGRSPHISLEHALPGGQHLGFHINAVAHGRQRCSLHRPQCTTCPVADFCIAPQHGRYSRKVAAQPRYRGEAAITSDL